MEIDIPDLDDVKFEETCGVCSGSGIAKPQTYSKKKGAEPAVICWYCDGKKYRLTPVGNKLIDFLRNHYGLTPNETT